MRMKHKPRSKRNFARKKIAERKKAEEALRLSEQRYQLLFNNFSDPITVYSIDGTIQLINRVGARNLGGTPQNLIGKSVYRFFSRDMVDRLKKRERGIVKSGKGGIFEDVIKLPIGRQQWFRTNLQPIKSRNGKVVALQAISYDITERKKTEEEVQESEQKLSLTFENAKDAIFWADPKTGLVVKCNKAAESLLGRKRKEIIGHPQTLIHPPQRVKYYTDMFKKHIRQKRAVDEEAEVITKSGRIIPVHITASVTSIGGEEIIQGIFRDITERKKAEEILKRDKKELERIVSERVRQLAKAHKELEEVKRLSDIGTLATTIAHELRNPLGVIKTAVYNIKKKSMDPSLDSHLKNIDKKISESDQIIKNLLNYSRLKAPHLKNIPVLDTLHECVGHCKERYPRWNVKVKVDHNCKRNDLMMVDPLYIAELISNILDNAYQSFATKKGRIKIIVNCNRKKGKLDMNFHDNGVGIDKKDLSRVFDPFFTKKAKGIGLGLTVCNQVVDLHGGKINIKSKKDEGTTVHVTLPLKKKV